jgi:putative transposase
MKKMRIYPTNKQKVILNKWFGTYRFVYNRMVAYSQNPNSTWKDWYLYDPNHYMDFYAMRDHFVTENEHLNNWEYETPKDIRRDAIHTFHTSLKGNLTKLKKNNINKFKMQFKKKNVTHTIGGISKSAVKKVKDGFKIYTTYTNGEVFKVKTRSKKKLLNFDIESDCIINFDGVHYNMFLPYKKKVKENKQKEESTIAFDPGVRTFQTGFSDKEYIEISSQEDKINKLYKKIDNLTSLKSKAKITNKKRYAKRILKYFKKIRNRTDDIHYRTINYVKNNYTDILLPIFKSHDMVQGCLTHGTKRKMNTLRHYRFQQRLKETAMEVKDLRVHIVNEAYTTKTCTNCGTIKNNVGGQKIYNCDNCKISIGRDINASRGILLKYLSI